MLAYQVYFYYLTLTDQGGIISEHDMSVNLWTWFDTDPDSPFSRTKLSVQLWKVVTIWSGDRAWESDLFGSWYLPFHVIHRPGFCNVFSKGIFGEPANILSCSHLSSVWFVYGLYPHTIYHRNKLHADLHVYTKYTHTQTHRACVRNCIQKSG